eukprot:6568202-Pyramimonas_sp.AAC.1
MDESAQLPALSRPARSKKAKSAGQPGEDGAREEEDGAPTVAAPAPCGRKCGLCSRADDSYDPVLLAMIPKRARTAATA